MRRLSDIIHNPKPLIMRPATTVRRACEEMRVRCASAVLVADPDNYLLGIFTGRDALWRVLAEGKRAEEVTLREVMTKNPVTMTPSTTTIEALRLMWDGGFRHLPVTEMACVVGLVLRRDFKGEDLVRLDDEREVWEHMR